MAAITLVSSAAHADSGVTAAVDTSTFTLLRLTLAVTAALAAGAWCPSLEVELQTSADGNSWRTLHQFQTMTGADSVRAVVVPDNYVRVVWRARSPKFGEANGFTWSLTGTSHAEGSVPE